LVRREIRKESDEDRLALKVLVSTEATLSGLKLVSSVGERGDDDWLDKTVGGDRSSERSDVSKVFPLSVRRNVDLREG
jgi:hypothetical protein